MPPPWPAWSGCPAHRAAPTAPPGRRPTKNGYTDGVGGVTITHAQGPGQQPAPVGHDHRPGQHVLHEDLRDPVDPGRPRMSKAEYVLPVPMGSPENYYGVVRADPRSDLDEHHDPDRPQLVERRTPAGRSRRPRADADLDRRPSGTLVTSVNVNNNIYAQTTTANAAQQWSTFGLTNSPGRQPDDHRDRRDRGPPDRHVPVGQPAPAASSGPRCRGTTAPTGRRRPPRPGR